MSKPRLSLLFFAVLAASTAVLVTMVALLSWFHVGVAGPGVWPSLVVALTGVGVALSIIAIVHLSLVATRKVVAAGHERKLASWTHAWSDVATGLPLPLVPEGEVRLASEAAAQVLQVVSGDGAHRIRKALESRGVIATDQSIALRGLGGATPESTAALERLAWIAATSSIPLFEVAVTGSGRAARAGLLGLMRVLAAQSRPDDVGPAVVAAVEEHVSASTVPEGVRPYLTAVLADSGEHLGWLSRTLLAGSSHEAVQVAALDAIGSSQNPEAVDYAVGAVQRGATGETLSAALRVMAHVGHVPVVVADRVAAAATDGESVGVKVNATYALVGVEPAVALPILWRQLANASWEVRRAAADALVRLGGRGEEVLRRATASHRDRFARDVAAMTLAALRVGRERADGSASSQWGASTAQGSSLGSAYSQRDGDVGRGQGQLRVARGPA